MHKGQHKKILVAPLNWGLGHATRCIPIINALIRYDFEPILAGDGASLQLLKQEYPAIPYYELPSTGITYAKRAKNLKLKLLSQAPKLMKAMTQEKKKISEIHKKENLSGIISDNRFGVLHDEVPSIYITHQLQVLSGFSSFISTALHQRIISNFKECWIPDHASEGLAGTLSHPKIISDSFKYIGPLSRFSQNQKRKKWDLLVVLSGPEPQRGIFEIRLKELLRQFQGKIIMVQGIVESKQEISLEGNITIVNFMLHKELEDLIASSKLVLSRSGYSSIMDLYTMEAKAFFIPTPGQFEQEYLAIHLKKMNYAGYSEQQSFCLENLSLADDYQGFGHKKTSKSHLDRSLFDVFM